ncbi:hypothetical protein ABNavy1_020 [Acinetobacter phage AB-Navy1]|nr:hypothetical protein ABNavy1_020 [Acinetobacter phage AB-Navy1]
MQPDIALTVKAAVQLLDYIEEVRDSIIRLKGESYYNSQCIGMDVRVHQWIDQFSKSLSQKINNARMVNEIVDDPIKVYVPESALSHYNEVVVLHDVLKIRAKQNG